jgi:HK97 family phage portal protein
VPRRKRAIAASDILDPLALERRESSSRRQARTNTDIAMTLAAVYAAVRFRSVAIQKPRITLQRRIGGRWVDINDPGHPAAIHESRINSSLGWSEGLQLLEEHRLIAGNAIWVKKRNGLGVPVGFEVWRPDAVSVIRAEDDIHRVLAYRFTDHKGRTSTADPEDVIHFRHMLHPADWVWGVSPITAIRLESDAALEAQRWNIKLYDQGAHATSTFTMPEGVGDLEAVRVEEMMNSRMAGTDNAHRLTVLPGGVTPVMQMMSMADMEFLGQQKWTRNEAATAFELSPLALKDFEKATYQNAEKADATDWTVMLDQLRSTMRTFNEQMIWPDFSTDLRLYVPGDDIPALQSNMKDRAAVDEIYLRTAKTTVNEIRERDGQDPVPWGDVPYISTTLQPIGAAGVPAPPPEQTASLRSITPQPVTSDTPGLLKAERAAARRWEGRLRNEMRGMIAHLEAEAGEPFRTSRTLDPQSADSYAWEWLARYGDRVVEELAGLFQLSAEAAAFVDVGIFSAQDAARTYAQERAGALITNLEETTRRQVRDLVTKTIEEGRPLRELKNALREHDVFSASRAETIARTETAMAQGQGKRSAAVTQGRNEKNWITAGDAKVSPDICAPNGRQGWINIDSSFGSGHNTIPGHPRCRCDVQYRTSGNLQD